MSSLVKFFYEEMTNAPAGAVNTAGNMVTVLDACLVNGFNSHTITGGISCSGTTATVTDTAHGFVDQCVVNISGASVSACNGDFRITRINANSFSYQVPNATPSPTGTITALVAPLGWTIAYTAANQRVYQAPTGNQFFLSIDDSGTSGSVYTAEVYAFETCSGIGTGTAQNPPTGNMSGDNKHRWMRSQYVAGANQPGWTVIGDDKRFFLGTPGYSTDMKAWAFFGDFTTFLPADAYNCAIGGDCAHGNGASYYYYGQFPPLSVGFNRSGSGSFYTNEMSLQRAYDQSTIGVACALGGPFSYSPSSSYNIGNYQGTISYSGPSTVPVVSPITGSIELAPLDIMERDSSLSTTTWRRGRMPGVVQYLGNPWLNSNATNYANNNVVYSGVPVYGSVIQFTGAALSGTAGLVFVIGTDWDSM